jgi:hypothetical protein
LLIKVLASLSFVIVVRNVKHLHLHVNWKLLYKKK